jgi:putative acyl-CoA dehydrogenase
VDACAKAHAGIATLFAALRAALNASPEQREASARRFTQCLVLALQASLMLRHAPAASADMFIASRADAECGRVYGTLPASTSALRQSILERAWPGV